MFNHEQKNSRLRLNHGICCHPHAEHGVSSLPVQTWRWWALPCIISLMTHGWGSNSTWRTSTWWSPTEVLPCSLPLTSASPAGVSVLVYVVLAGMGIGSEVLRHLSNVSERKGSRGKCHVTCGHMTFFKRLYISQGDWILSSIVCLSFTLLSALLVGHKDALHRHDVCGGGEQWALHQVLQASRRRGPVPGGGLEALQVQPEQPG